MMESISTLTILSIFAVGFIGGFIGAIAGGGGLITIPFLIFLGLPPQISIATNKFGSIGFSIGAVTKYAQAKKVLWSYVLPFSVLSFFGAVIGAHILLTINQELLTKIVGIILLLIIPLFVARRDMGVRSHETTQIKKAIGYFLSFLISIFAGFFGGGAGMLARSVLTYFFGFTLIQISALGAIPIFVLSTTALTIYILNGVVNYSYGIPLFFGMISGSYIGAHTAVKKGDSWVKIIFITIILLSSIKILLLN